MRRCGLSTMVRSTTTQRFARNSISWVATNGRPTTATQRQYCMPTSSGVSSACSDLTACSVSHFGTSRTRELWLVRDRIGIKPLCYSIHDGRVTFASEIKALLMDPDQRRGINEEALYHYLSFAAAPAPHTMFAGVNKVPAGYWVRIKEDGQVQTRRYWDCLDHTTDLRGVSEGDICDGLMSQLRESVKLQKMSDRQTGVFLSGAPIPAQFRPCSRRMKACRSRLSQLAPKASFSILRMKCTTRA